MLWSCAMHSLLQSGGQRSACSSQQPTAPRANTEAAGGSPHHPPRQAYSHLSSSVICPTPPRTTIPPLPPARLINRIKAGSVPKINDPATMPFKQMENIANALKGIRALGMREMEMFGTPDLYEEKNVPVVVRSIHALGRLLQTIMPDSRLPKLGIKVVEKNERHFSEQQMLQARSAVSVLNLGSSDMAKKATANLLEGKDSQAFLGKA